MSHRFFNWMLAVALLGIFIAAQQLDARDFESELQAEQRDWHYAMQHCLRAYGAQTQPEYTEDGKLVCVSRRGEVLPYRVATK